ncbi:hypothetical protein CEXT_39211 [Caerostris extrusa]|uniref:Uncharacterized protein n=1 Tax=Caerostris extrusa TaxID=172846 RepID=A0AAV4X0M2_CAEEX|nr:hypothetical protein CEXT_39211 [Caerostris extrusa]
MARCSKSSAVLATGNPLGQALTPTPFPEERQLRSPQRFITLLKHKFISPVTAMTQSTKNFNAFLEHRSLCSHLQGRYNVLAALRKRRDLDFYGQRLRACC